MARRALCVALFVVALGPVAVAGAQETPPGRITVEGPGGATSGQAGSSVTIRGAGFQPGDQINIHWAQSSGPVIATASGPIFQVGATIPPATPGIYNVIASGFDAQGSSIGQAVDQFTVVAAPAGGPAPRPNPGIYNTPFPPVPAFAGCSSLASNVLQGAGTITGTVLRDRIFGSAGVDVVRALEGDDCADLRAGADRGSGGPGADLLLGGLGRDRLDGGLDDDTLRGGAGADRIATGGGGDRASGQAGDDRVAGGSGADRLQGGSGRDRISGGSGSDRISGGSGRDRISARDRVRDRISCGGGVDRVVADRGDRVARSCERVRRR